MVIVGGLCLAQGIRRQALDIFSQFEMMLYNIFLVLEGDIIMKKVSFRIRNFDKERFLTYDIDNEATLDEEVLDFLEEEEPKGIVPIIFEEGDEFDTFSYNVTDKIRLCELSEQEINAEMVLRVMRGLVLSLVDMSEYRVPLSYLVLHRNYIFINSDYEVEFICVPLEEMQEEVDINSFLRNFVASLRFESSENGDYVAKLLSYINNTAIFSLRNMVTVVEDLMDVMGVELLEESSNDIYVDYQEVLNDDDDDEEEISIGGDTSILTSAVGEESTEEEVVEEETAEEEEVVEEETAEEEEVAEEETAEEEEVVEEEIAQEEEAVEEETVEDVAEEQSDEMAEAESIIADLKKLVESKKSTPETTEKEESKVTPKKSTFKTKDTSAMTSVVIEDDFDAFLAEKEKEEKESAKKGETTGLKIRKNIKVNRASVAMSNQEELKEEAKEEEVVSNSILSQTVGVTGILKGADLPKANPYLIRVNTEERIMITKQNFKVGKASMGVDYAVRGNSAVSRIHAIITSKDDVYYVKDNKSTNHTFVNGKMLGEGESELLTHDCKIVLADEEFVFKLR